MLIIPPSLIILRVNHVCIWLPVFLLWPIVAALELVLFPFAITAALLAWPRWGTAGAYALALALPRVTGLLAATRGLYIDVHDSNGRHVTIRLI